MHTAKMIRGTGSTLSGMICSYSYDVYLPQIPLLKAYSINL